MYLTGAEILIALPMVRQKPVCENCIKKGFECTFDEVPCVAFISGHWMSRTRALTMHCLASS